MHLHLGGILLEIWASTWNVFWAYMCRVQTIFLFRHVHYYGLLLEVFNYVEPQNKGNKEDELLGDVAPPPQKKKNIVARKFKKARAISKDNCISCSDTKLMWIVESVEERGWKTNSQIYSQIS